MLFVYVLFYSSGAYIIKKGTYDEVYGRHKNLKFVYIQMNKIMETINSE